MDFDSLKEEAQQMLSSLAEVLTSTMQQGVEVVRNYEELAKNKVSAITNATKKELADLSAYGESVKSCVERRQSDFQKVEDKLRKDLAACYTKNYGALDKILADKSAIHEEAQQIKNELEKQMISCMSAANKTECFTSALNGLKKRFQQISTRTGQTLQREAEARVKSSKAVFDCDKKAMDEAYKKCTAIVNEVKECAGKQKEHTSPKV